MVLHLSVAQELDPVPRNSCSLKIRYLTPWTWYKLVFVKFCEEAWSKKTPFFALLVIQGKSAGKRFAAGSVRTTRQLFNKRVSRKVPAHLPRPTKLPYSFDATPLPWSCSPTRVDQRGQCFVWEQSVREVTRIWGWRDGKLRQTNLRWNEPDIKHAFPATLTSLFLQQSGDSG